MTGLHVSEVFGPTWQGEGPHAGVRTGFVRLGLCNLSCEWCDTPYTWDTKRYDLAVEAPPVPVPLVHAQLAAMDVDTVCLSGGEPLIHHHQLPELLDRRWTWHAETNGTIDPPDYWVDRVAHTSVSPKINTRDPLHRRIRPDVLAHWNHLAFQGRACFKFVASHPRDLKVVAELVEDVGIAPSNVWIMPEGTTTEALVAHHQALAEGINEHGWNTTTRLHVLLYGDVRGR